MSSSELLVQKLIQGKSPLHIQGYYIWSVILAYILVVLISSALFPVPYSMLQYHISALGGIARNPEGYLVYNIGIILIGIATIPHILFIYNHLRTLLGSWHLIAKITGIIGCLAFSGLGLFPEDRGLIHIICAVSSFLGFIFTALIIYFSSIEDIKKQYSFSTVILFSFLSIYILLTTIIVILIPGFFRWFTFPFIDPASINFSPYEWLLMNSLLTWLGGMYFVIYRISKSNLN